MQKLLPIIPLLAFSALHAQNTETGAAFKNNPAPQQIVIRLEEKSGKAAHFAFIQPSAEIKDEKTISGFKKPEGEYPHFYIRRIAVNRLQHSQDQYVRGEISREKHQKYLDWYTKKADTTPIHPTPFAKSGIYFFVGLDKEGKKHVIADENNNGDFSDDRTIVVDTADCYEIRLSADDKRPTIDYDVDVAYYDGEKIQEKKLWINVNPYEFHFSPGDYGSRTEQLLDIQVMVRIGWEGMLDVDGKRQKVFVHTVGPSLIPMPRAKLYMQLESDSASGYHYAQGENIQLGTGVYKWHPVAAKERNDRMLMILDKVADHTPYSASVGDPAPDFSGMDLLSGKPVSLKGLKGNYVLIDFWGTWCGPCKEMIPDLVKQYAKYKNKKVKFISIAWDYKKEEHNLKEMIKGFGMEWLNIHQDRETHGDEKSPSTMYKVQVFPTMFIIDDRGKIVFRGAGSDHLDEAAAVLDKWIAKQ